MELNSSVAMSISNDTQSHEILSSNTSNVFCPGLADFSVGYRRVHGYVSLVVCLFGSVANSLNIAVLTRREMTSPTNALLTGLAVADLLVMLEYIPFACHMYMPQSTSRTATDQYSYAWAVFVLFHSNFAQARQSYILAPKDLSEAATVSVIFCILSTTLTCGLKKERLPHLTVLPSPCEEPLQRAICEQTGLQMKLL